MHLLEVVGSFSEKIRPGSCTRNLKWWEKLHDSLGWWRMMRVSIKMVVYTDEKISTPVTLKKQVIRYRYCNRYILGLLWILKRNSDTRRRDSLSLRLKSCLISLFHFLCVKKKTFVSLFSKCITTFVSHCRSQAVLESSNAGLKRPGYIATWLHSPREHCSISRSHAASKVVQWTRSILLATCRPCSPSCYEKCKHKMAKKTVMTFFRAGQEVCVVKSDKLLL